MKNFEENLKKLEELSNDIRRNDISLEDALKDFEEGITLAKSLEKEIDKIEGKIQILVNQPVKGESEPELDLFTNTDTQTGTSGSPELGLRQND